ncbi:peptide chain release factor N(5)-glutamine methyltransferase [Candidatus Babeliales bacterium]|nr:peptide chain release factor N(5)-glutamine methyltransferase [Candidatus Babeliales bacterium]
MECLHDLVKTIERQLQERYKDTASRQQAAWWLLARVTGKTKGELLVNATVTLLPEQHNLLKQLIHDHVELHRPLQYIMGTVPFWELEIYVEPPILIPRPETEEWVIGLVEQLLTLEQKHLAILDIGTGTGCISVSLAHALPEATIWASDISSQALALSKKNARHNHVNNIQLIHSDTFSSIPKGQKFDLIVSNPPYISEQEWSTLDPSVTEWEDHKALRADDKGLKIIKEIINGAHAHLKPNDEMKQRGIPQMVIEFGYKQGPAVHQLAQQAGFHNVRLYKDMSGNDRIVYAEL